MDPIRPKWPEVPEGFFDPPNAGHTGGSHDAASDQFRRGLGGANPPPAGLRQGQQYSVWDTSLSGRGGGSNTSAPAQPMPMYQASQPTLQPYGGHPGSGGYAPPSNLPPNPFLHRSPVAPHPHGAHGGSYTPTNQFPPFSPPLIAPPSSGLGFPRVMETHTTHRTNTEYTTHTTRIREYGAGGPGGMHPHGGLGASGSRAIAPPRPAPPPLSPESASYIANYFANLPYKDIRNPPDRRPNELKMPAITRNLNQRQQSSLAWGQQPPKDYSVTDVETHLKPLFNELETSYGNPDAFDNNRSIAQLRIERMRFTVYPEDFPQSREYRKLAPSDSSSSDAQSQYSGASGSSSGRIGSNPSDYYGDRPQPYPPRAGANDRSANDRSAATSNVNDPFAFMGPSDQRFAPQGARGFWPPSQTYPGTQLGASNASHARSSAAGSRLDQADPLAHRYQHTLARTNASRPLDFGNQFHSMELGPQRVAPPETQGFPSSSQIYFDEHGHNPSDPSQASSSAAGGSRSNQGFPIEPPAARYEPASTASGRDKGKARADQVGPNRPEGYGEYGASDPGNTQQSPAPTAEEILSLRKGSIERELAGVMQTTEIGDRSGKKKARAALEQLNRNETKPKIPLDAFLGLYDTVRHRRSDRALTERNGGETRRQRRIKIIDQKIPDPPANAIIGEGSQRQLTDEGKRWVSDAQRQNNSDNDIALKLQESKLMGWEIARDLVAVKKPPQRN
jgi:hypothetical protein